MKRVQTLVLLWLVPLVLGGCSSAKTDTTTHIIEREIGGEMIHDSVTIDPSGSYEECIDLRPGLVFDYEFEASEDVNFNIHYHGTDDIHEPVNSKGVHFGKGRIDPATHKFYTEEQTSYCLMWDNVNDKPVNVSFKCVLELKKENDHRLHH